MIRIPPERLDKETLEAITEDFVLREGTDYGVNEHSLASKISQLLKQIERGEVAVSYDDTTESCTLMTRHDAQKNGLI